MLKDVTLKLHGCLNTSEFLELMHEGKRLRNNSLYKRFAFSLVTLILTNVHKLMFSN